MDNDGGWFGLAGMIAGAGIGAFIGLEIGGFGATILGFSSEILGAFIGALIGLLLGYPIFRVVKSMRAGK